MQDKINLSSGGDLDAALVVCLRIAAERGRQIRENGGELARKTESPNTANVGAQARNEQRTAAISFGIIAQTKGARQDAKTL